MSEQNFEDVFVTTMTRRMANIERRMGWRTAELLASLSNKQTQWRAEILKFRATTF